MDKFVPFHKSEEYEYGWDGNHTIVSLTVDLVILSVSEYNNKT